MCFLWVRLLLSISHDCATDIQIGNCLISEVRQANAYREMKDSLGDELMLEADLAESYKAEYNFDANYLSNREEE